jgi:hypothetical protein
MTAGPQFMPEALARWFRSRPTGASLNLIRKELRLQQPIWLFALLAVLIWLYLIVSGIVPEWAGGGPDVPPPSVAIPIAVAGCLSLVMAVLAGCLSLGEERTSGTHSWHLTLPVSTVRQWLIKLGMAMFTSFICAWAVPVVALLAAGSAHGTPFLYLRDPMSWLIALLLITVVSFWCACAVKGTWPAVLWLFPAMGAVLLAGEFGNWAAQHLTQTSGTLREVLVAGLHLDPRAFRSPNDIGTALLWFYAPASIFAVFQGYRMFRTQPQDSSRGIARGLRTLVIIVLVCSFSVSAAGFGGDSLPMIAGVSGWSPFYETRNAIEKLQTGPANLDAAQPRQFTVDDLARAAPLSPLTQRWLRDSRTTIAPNQPVAGGFAKHHAATIRLASGLECQLSVTNLANLKPIYRWSACEPAQP